MNKLRTVLVAVPLIAALLAGCGDNSGNSDNNTTSDGSGTFQDASASTCFTEMTPQQKTELQQYANNQGDNLGATSSNSDGTQDVCVIEKSSDGTYNQHYYKREDAFADYALYSILFGHSNALLAYGVYTGSLDPAQAMALSLLTGANNQGMMYHPYSYINNQWMRSPQVMNYNVTNVYYGSKPNPVPYASSFTSQPSGYRSQSMQPPSDKTATMSGGRISQTSSSGAGNTIKNVTGSAAGTTKLQNSGSGTNKTVPNVNPAPAPPKVNVPKVGSPPRSK
jgi:hypothetical protein